MTAKFHIPDFWVHWDLNLTLIDMIRDHPEYFRDVEIVSCYGCFPSVLWNGGRALAGTATIDQAKYIMNEFNSRNVPIRFTFTNPTLTEKDVNDPLSNIFCRMADNGLNEIIINKPFLEDYIRATYPNYKLTSSTVKQIEDYDTLMEEFKKDYKLVVLDYNWNNDFEKLARIPQELRSRVEILINPYCTPHCKRRKQHYEVLGRGQRLAAENPALTIGRDKNGRRIDPHVFDEAVKFDCPNTTYNFYQVTHYSTFISNEDLFSRYLDMGFQQFKIEGRVLSAENVIESYVYYLVKPEYRDRIRLDLLTRKRTRTLPVPQEHPRLFIDRNGREIPQKRR